MNVYEVVKNRRTIRKFKQEPVDIELLKKYVDAARVAPCGANRQPLKYKIVNEKELVTKIESLVKWAGYINPLGDPKDDEKPVAFIAVFADTEIKQSGYEVDMGAAVQSMILTAEDDGVGSCWLGAIKYDEITELLNVPKNLKLLCVVAMGYKAEQPKECEAKDGDIKYFKDENGVLQVPKRSLDEVLL